MGKWDRLSKFISLVLRHNPDAAGIRLDGQGWADVEELLAGINRAGRKIDLDILKEIVASDSKKRYSFNEDMTRIRANQGHSVQVDVELKECEPPQYLYHGTALRFLPDIEKEGLKPMGRLYVHLSKDTDTALKVGKRHGAPVVLKIHSEAMARDGYTFYLSENGVWLTKNVKTIYIEKLRGCREIDNHTQGQV